MMVHSHFLRLGTPYLLGIFFLPFFCFGQWTNQTLPTNTRELFGITFVNEQVGYAVGFLGTVVKTTDGGLTWSKQIAPSGSYYSPVFFGPDTGFVAGNSGFVLRTNNGGLDWFKQPVTGTSQNYGICFPSRMRGYMVGDSGRMVKTVDGGSTWITMASGIGNNLHAIYFTHPDTGYVTADSGKVLRTFDGGVTWVLKPIATNNTIRTPHFFSADSGLVVGEYGSYYETTNGGAAWTQIPFGITDPLVSLVFIDRYTGYMASLTKVYKTVSGGDSWVEMGGMSSGNLIRDICFLPSGVGYAVGRTLIGAKGFVYKYTPQVTVQPALQPMVSPLYPNPSTGFYRLESGKGGTLLVTDGLGRLCQKLVLMPGTNRIDLQNLGKGVYSVQIKTVEGVSVQRVVVE